MHEGIVDFIRPEECKVHKDLHELEAKKFDNSNSQNVDEVYAGLLGDDN